MKTENQPLVISQSGRIYTALLIFYPTAYRQEYGAHMAQLFHDMSRDMYQQQGVLGIMFWWCSTLLDLVVTVIEQRKAGKTAMSNSLTIRPTKGAGLGLMCIMGGLIYFAGGLWLSISGVPTDTVGIQLTHLLRMMWAGGANCGLMGMIVAGAIEDGHIARAAAWLSALGFVIIFIDALGALIVRNPAASFSGFPLPFSSIGQIVLLIGWVMLIILTLGANRWTGWSRFTPLVMLLAPFVGLLLAGLLNSAFLTVEVMGLGLLLFGFAVQIHLNEKRRAANKLVPVLPTDSTPFNGL